MKITSFTLKNYRRLADVTLVLDDKTTVLVGANNSGKTSCVGALYTFLKSPENLKIRDISKWNWKKIQNLGERVEQKFPVSNEMHELSSYLVSLLPSLDVEIAAEASEAYKVRDILPNLEWRGGPLSIRITYEATDIFKLFREFIDARRVVSGHESNVNLWPKDLYDFLEKGRNFSKFIKQKHYILSKESESAEDVELTTKEILQPLKLEALKKLIRVDVISEQRGLGAEDTTNQKGPYSEKQRLNKLLREYYEQILNPEDFPEVGDLKVLEQQQKLEKDFGERLNTQFEAPLEELKNMGYPGIGGNPSVEIYAKISGTDALQKSSSVQYRFDKNEEEFIPESYLGLGYQNLIYLTFRLLEFRDKWMRVGKSSFSENSVEAAIEPIHLVLLEEPEVNLHAQVQRVFVSKAYDTLRNHFYLEDKETKKNKPEYQTQLVISTHSSHIINDIDFKDLRYFRRNEANKSISMDHTLIENMSDLFAKPKDELLFVKKHLKLTHCDIFFADGVIFVEGQAESILVPEFIAKNHQELSKRYISMLEVNGAHTHKYKDLVEKLGIPTLVLTDLDSVSHEGKACYPQRESNQLTANYTLKEWHPMEKHLDKLVNLPKEKHVIDNQVAPIYIAYQKPTLISGEEVLSRTFEDALILANFEDEYFKEIINKLKAAKNDFVSNTKSLVESLHDYVQKLNKGEFAFNCLFHLAKDEANRFNPPEYMRDGLLWLENQLSPKS